MAVSKKKTTEAASSFEHAAKKIITTPMTDEVERSFLEYSYAVIYSRALPDIRDGLKPVQRRILYTMLKENFLPDRDYVKSARTSGVCMGLYHPHGDSSIYDAMVRMAQPSAMMVPLIDGYGNWGRVGVPAASARYTEARLAKEAMLLLNELREDTVEMRPNYDGKLMEPVILPVQFPNLLVNGVSGIAVGFATNMPPHNPTEVLDAARWLLTHPDASLERLMQFIPGPDFPTGGSIIGLDEIREAYETGRGVFRIRGRATIGSLPRGRSEIVFDELPYNVPATKIIEKAKEAISKNQLSGIADIKDLTDRRNGIRLVFETKVGVNPKALLADIYKYTPLEDSFGINNVALVNGEPKTVGLREMLQVFLSQRAEIVTLRTQRAKEKRADRLHIVEGLVKALAKIDEVIRIIRTSDDTESARTSLIKSLKVDDVQANYILDIPLRRLTKYDVLELNTEKQKLENEIAGYDFLLNDEKELRRVIGTELDAVKKTLHRERSTVLVGGSLAEHQEASKAEAKAASVEIEDEPCFISLTAKRGLVRSATVPSAARNSAATTTRGKFIAITNRGRAFRLESIVVPTREVIASNVLPSKLDNGEVLLAVAPVDLPEGASGGVALATRRGSIKIATPAWPVRSDEFSVISLAEGDEVVAAEWIPNAAEYRFFLVSSDSSLLTFPADKVRPQGLSGSGMAGINLAEGATVVAFAALAETEIEAALLVTHTESTIKATPASAYPAKGRATGGVRSHRFLRGETQLTFAAVARKGSKVLTSTGAAITLPETDNRRDGSGSPSTLPS